MKRKKIMKRMCLATLIIFPIAATENPTRHDAVKKTVKMYHCTTQERAKIILEDGLKSSMQLAREANTEVCYHRPTSNHHRSIYFQYIDPSRLNKIGPKLWQRKEGGSRDHCIAIEVDPSRTIVYNPDLRFFHPFNKFDRSIYDYRRPNYMYYMNKREDIYKSSGIPLEIYIEREKDFLQTQCHPTRKAFPHPLTAEPQCMLIVHGKQQTGYYWSEHTVERNRIDPSEFAQ